MCCAAFYFSSSHEEVATRAPQDADDYTLKEMLVPITSPRELRERREEFGLPPMKIPKDTSHFFKCNKWDEETGLCTIYERRPKMCRDYPYEGKCDYGCSFRPPPNVIQQYIQDHLDDKARPK